MRTFNRKHLLELKRLEEKLTSVYQNHIFENIYKNRNNKYNELKKISDNFCIWDVLNKEDDIKSMKNKKQLFNRIYESNNKKDDEDENLIVVTNGKHIFSEIPQDIIVYLKNTSGIEKGIFDIKKNKITISNYWDLLDAIKAMIKIIEHDMISTYIKNKYSNIEIE